MLLFASARSSDILNGPLTGCRNQVSISPGLTIAFDFVYTQGMPGQKQREVSAVVGLYAEMEPLLRFQP